MNPMSLARLTRSSKIALLLLGYFLVTIGSVCASDGIKKPGELSPELIRKIEEAVKSFQKPLEEKQYREIVDRAKQETGKRFQTGKQAEAKPCGQSDPVYYFISFSMPEETILGLMREGIRINRRCEERVVFVLRGFVENNLKKTVSTFYRLQQRIGEEAFIEVNPELFDEFRVERVPFAVRSISSVTGRIGGDLAGPGYAISKFREELKDHGVYGRTYPIAEANILELISARQKEVERSLKERLPEIQKRMLTLSRFDGKFEHVKKERVYYINPKVVLRDDIVDHRGEVIFPKGTIFDPTKYVRLGRYIVIDGNSPKQVEFALSGEFRKIILISGDLGKLARTYKQKFYFATEDLIRKFRIERVPVIIEGEGEYVKVTEKVV